MRASKIQWYRTIFIIVVAATAAAAIVDDNCLRPHCRSMFTGKRITVAFSTENTKFHASQQRFIVILVQKYHFIR